MAKKKKVVRKKSIEQKPARVSKCSKWVLPVLIIIFIAIVAFVVFLQWPNMSKMFMDKHADNFDEAVKIVGDIDKLHNISFSQYDNGIYYFDSNPRYPNPFNFDEMDEVIKEYKSISSANSVKEAVELFKTFRAKLVGTEKYYRLSKKSGRADLQKTGVVCKNEPYVNESIANKMKSIETANEMAVALDALKQKYPDYYNSLNLSEHWVDLMKNIPVDLEGEIRFTEELWNEFCNQTNKNATNATSTPEIEVKKLLPSSWKMTVKENTRPDVWGGADECKAIFIENPSETVPYPGGNMTAQEAFWFCPKNWNGQVPTISPVEQTYPAVLLCNCTDYLIFATGVTGTGGNSMRGLSDKVKAAFS